MSRVSLLGSIAVAGLAIFALSAALATLIRAITATNETLNRGNCLRECEAGNHYTCQFEFQVHSYQTYSWNCKTCENLSCTNKPGCIQADGITRLITVVNAQLPGPSIQVCKGDTVKVTVDNRLVSSGVSMHWHGLTMRSPSEGSKGFVYMDGEPGVTQCPIVPHGKFTYTFVADPPGTHFWHAQTGFQRGDGVFGSLVVRSPKGYDPNDHLYDRDLSEHVIMVNDWTHILGEEKFFLHLLSSFTDFPKSILVNGLGPHEGNSIVSIPHPVKHKRFEVVKGLKYRFRLISGAFLNCPMSVSVSDHLLTVIASDGTPIIPFNVSSIVIHPGERWDFVLHADQYPQPYWFSFMGQGDCIHDEVFQNAILDYVPVGSSYQAKQFDEDFRKDVRPLKSKPKFTKRKPRGKQLNSFNGICEYDTPCLSDLQSSSPLPEELKKERADETFYLGFSKSVVNSSFVNSHFPNVLRGLQFPPNAQIPISLINGFTFNTPSTPLIYKVDSFEKCDFSSAPQQSHQHCLHIIKMPLGKVVDLVLIDSEPHYNGTVVHLHGYKFFVLKEEWNVNKNTGVGGIVDIVKGFDAKVGIPRNLLNPIQKDTVAVPHKGYVIVRFLADNPGFWVMQSQLLFDAQLGMKVVFQIGETQDIPKPPMNFPQCGDFR